MPGFAAVFEHPVPDQLHFDVVSADVIITNSVIHTWIKKFMRMCDNSMSSIIILENLSVQLILFEIFLPMIFN